MEMTEWLTTTCVILYLMKHRNSLMLCGKKVVITGLFPADP